MVAGGETPPLQINRLKIVLWQRIYCRFSCRGGVPPPAFNSLINQNLKPTSPSGDKLQSELSKMRYVKFFWLLFNYIGKYHNLNIFTIVG